MTVLMMERSFSLVIASAVSVPVSRYLLALIFVDMASTSECVTVFCQVVRFDKQEEQEVGVKDWQGILW